VTSTFLLVELETDDASSAGAKPTTAARPDPRRGKAIIEHAFAPAIIGGDPLDTDVTWDRLFHMHRSHGFQGAPVEALSAIRHRALDLKGKLLASR